MPQDDYLEIALPTLAARLDRERLANLPTPVDVHEVVTPAGSRTLVVKHDNLSGDLYGGNKVRKLEYLFARARRRGRERVATFGAAGSNHALATALYAYATGFGCTCFLGHQVPTPAVAAALRQHLDIGTELVLYRGSYRQRVETLRRSLWGRHAAVIPMGGSSWLGSVGFVAAGLELAAQLADSSIAVPDRIYVATGTMGTAAGLGLGLALAGLSSEVQAVRVSHESIANEAGLRRLIAKTALMMRRLDPQVPEDLAARVRVRLRHEFFGTGYARPGTGTLAAIEFGGAALGLTLEGTYTGKALAALLADVAAPGGERLRPLYWHTYNSAPLPDGGDPAVSPPEDFRRYFEESVPARPDDLAP